MTKYLIAHTDVLWVGSRTRVADDPRDDMDPYTTADLTLIAMNFIENFETRLMIHNLFDKKYEDPDLSGVQQLIANDYPKAGFSAMIEVSYRF
ncbi:TonB-dependent receptor [Desulfococcaceae bacterium HSG8]|nr:TonB-dependent receptor [Desulfococcaceae bacterium HSG8]